MRIVRLDLRAFGSFAGAPPLEFDRGDRGLHLILGANEAGKSTALRAIRRLLFGFPHQAGDNHRHKYDDLRIGATLRAEDGRELAFVRRKKDLKPLWNFDDLEPIDPASLAPFLGGLDQARFLDLFSMDHAELIQGGQAILKGGGRIGEVLFAAGSGLGGIDEVRKALDLEVERLFKPTGKIPVINAALSELANAQALARKSMLATSDWVELDAQITRAKRQLDEVEAERRAVEALKNRREAVAKALPILRRRDEEADQLALLKDVPILAPGFADLRRSASTDRDLARRVADEAASSLAAIARDLIEVGPLDPVLDELEAIGRVQAGLGVYRKARQERPARQSRLARAEAEARSLLAEFLPGRSIDQAIPSRSVASSRGLIQELAQQSGQLEAAFLRAGQEVQALAASLPGPTDGPSPLDADRLAEDLAAVIGRVSEAGQPEARRLDDRAERVEAERQADVDLRALRLWSGSLGDLETLQVPSLKTIDRFEVDLRTADEAVIRAESARLEAVAERHALDREIEAARRLGAVPSEGELESRRAARESTWRSIRAGWLGEGSPVAPSPPLADRFEAETRAADDLADRLRREADRVADQSRREAERSAVAERLETLAATLARSIVDRDRLSRDWEELWRALEVAPLPPREMRDWVAIDRDALVKKAEAIRKLRAREERSAAMVEELRAELSRGLARLGEPPGDPLDSLPALLARARRAVERVGRLRELGEARSRLAVAGEAREAWRSRWAAAVGPLGLDRDASPARALSLLDGVDRAIKAMEEHSALVEAVAQADEVIREWGAAVESIADRLEVDRRGVEAEDLARTLLGRLDRARERKTRREGLLAREALERARLEAAQAELERASVALEALAREARCGSADNLEAAERASDDVRERKQRLQAWDERLADLAGTLPVGTFLDEARIADGGAIELEIAGLADRLAPLDEQRARLSEEIGGCHERLRRMDGGPLAAEAQQLVEDRAARLLVDVEHYARVRLASAVLRDAVERHRREHQGPVLDRAGALFASLTDGSFAGLRTDVDDKGQPVLLGVRAGLGGESVKVDAMSEGTADQLYLALRLASLQTHLDAQEPMPLVVDDLLVNFDNARAEAALRVLADLSRRTQILFFTHHAHLVDLARLALPEGVLVVHHLDCASASPAAIEAVKPRRNVKSEAAGGG